MTILKLLMQISSNRMSSLVSMSNGTTTMLDRALGCMYGQAIGDALGARYEFDNADAVTKQIANEITKNDGFLPILGGGPWTVAAGQVTDDTELAMGLCRSLLLNGTYRKADVSAAYYRWATTNPKDIGIATRNALLSGQLSDCDRRNLNADTVYEAMVANARKHNSDSLSNGCLMRISPLGIAGCDWPVEQLIETAITDCQMTHPNPISGCAVASFVVAIQCLLRGGTSEEAFGAAMQTAANNSSGGVVAELLNSAKTHPSPVNINGVEYRGDGAKQGYFGVALQSAFYELLHCNTFYDGLISAVSRGGDTDTNGCITGSLLGAKYGAANIPLAWKDTVRSLMCDRHSKYPSVILSDIETFVPTLIATKPPSR